MTVVTPYSPLLSCYEETSLASSRLFFRTRPEVGNVNHIESCWATAYSGRGLVRHTKSSTPSSRKNTPNKWNQFFPFMSTSLWCFIKVTEFATHSSINGNQKIKTIKITFNIKNMISKLPVKSCKYSLLAIWSCADFSSLRKTFSWLRTEWHVVLCLLLKHGYINYYDK